MGAHQETKMREVLIKEKQKLESSIEGPGALFSQWLHYCLKAATQS